MPRYRLDLEYDGTPFAGWQRQTNALSVQEAVENAITAFCGEDVRLRAAGRTDAGVHALGQVVHMDLARDWPPGTVRDALNAYMRDLPVVVLAAAKVGPDFDARFSAVRRRYLYRIVDRRAPLVLDACRAWHAARPLDADAMAEGARLLVGHHDFTTFRAAACQARSPVKTLDRLEVAREGEDIAVHAESRSFLHSQVRSMVGSLKLVGEGKWAPEHVAAALAARDRRACGALAPPHGLYLVEVGYPAEAGAEVAASRAAPPSK